VGAGVVELTVGGGRLQAGANASWLQLLMEGSYLVPAGQRYLWPFPGPVHRRNEVHDVGSGWNPAEGHGTAAEDEGELGSTRKARRAKTQQWER